MSIKICKYSTRRLIVREWHSISPDEWKKQDLDVVVKNILTERVTYSLPPKWQGTYTLERARNWIQERDDEGVTLLVVEKDSRMPIGLMILFVDVDGPDGPDLRLGYMLAESAWGKGLASELIGGFVAWCQNNKVASITGGVERANIASRRVLEKCGFVCEAAAGEEGEQLFVLDFRPDR